ncbi:hypothetical protein AAC03nite_39400 [Alicyclobacillus acidoterrestris]|nr:hypothetical protein AAC03nite_39400 [Alicyclobacillus acidoterrestris]
MDSTLNDLLAQVSDEVTLEDVESARNFVEQAKQEEEVRNYYRMFAAAPRK